MDKFEELMAAKQSTLCLFATRKACQDFNLEKLSRLQADTKEIPCVDEVDETTGTLKWNKKATEEMKKLNSDCNLTTGLEAVLQVAIGARVMLRRNIDTAVGLLNCALGTVMSIRTHHITVHFDGMHEPHHIERVKSRFMVLKKIYIRATPTALAVTVHKCQGLSLDCAMMELCRYGLRCTVAGEEAGKPAFGFFLTTSNKGQYQMSAGNKSVAADIPT